MSDFRPGQLWTSGAEPELGLGLVVAVDARSVEVVFDAADCRRRYARSTAPLVRAAFAPGDAILARDGSSLLVRAVEEADGLLVYSGVDRRLVESEVAPRQGAPGPVERLRRGEADPGSLFDLRQEAFAHRHRLARSPVRGLVGARIRLLPHQLFVASEVAGRDAPRALLADEVGLGKTIEAGLVASRLLATGRVERVLVATPEHLVHQWFVELLRRFNLRFRIYDEERCAAAESASGGNPFLDEQLVLCGLPLLAGPGGRGAQAAAAGWDLLVVDEVHHLSWAPRAPSPGWAAVAALARSAAGVLLLSGTPSRRGEQSHFARLHLLDPVRHPDWESHVAEAAREEESARLVALAAPAASAVPDDGSLVLDGADREAEAVALDRLGPGRALFRNTRASVGGFPRRVERPAPIEAEDVDPGVLEAIAREVASDPSLPGACAAAGPVEGTIAVLPGDPRVPWLVGLIRRTAPGKLLVVARTAGQVLSLADALEHRISVKRAVFHEGMTLVQRDRQAAWFAEPDGARVLLSSEIGGEGRNFQFAHHLVLFDLPLDPEQLEQRIGRLDRIGQERDVVIHVPFVVGSAGEVLHRWYADGLDAFERPAPDGNTFLERFGPRLVELATTRHVAGGGSRAAHDGAVERLVRETRALRDEVAARHAAGRDRLLELASFRRAEASSIVGAIAAQDADPALRDFLERAFDHAGVEVEDLAPGLWRLCIDETSDESFPGLGPEGATATFDREIACRREDAEFLTWDHPIATGALDRLLSSPAGTLALATFAGEPAGESVVEAFFVLETSAPARLGLGRFLPSTPVRVAVDRDLRDRGRTFATRERELRDVPPALAGEWLQRLRAQVEPMIAAARAAAAVPARSVVEEAVDLARAHFAAERERIEALVSDVDPGRPGLLAEVARTAAEATEWIRAARPRLDAVRILVARPSSSEITSA